MRYYFSYDWPFLASTPRAEPVATGFHADEEAAALAYNEAVIAADLADIREINRVDATGRPLPRD